MTLSIAVESPLTPEARQLIAASQAAMLEVYEEDEIFSLTADELTAPGISFLVARIDGLPVGCIALHISGPDAEIKRLYVSSEGRGQGIGKALVLELEAQAKAAGFDSVKIETGEKLAAAVALYRTLGYVERGRFGNYADHPASLFMEKRF